MYVLSKIFYTFLLSDISQFSYVFFSVILYFSHVYFIIRCFTLFSCLLYYQIFYRSLPSISPVIRSTADGPEHDEHNADTNHSDTTDHSESDGEVFVVNSEENLLDTAIY